MTDNQSEPSDINEIVRAEWRDENTPFERIWAVVKHTYEGQSAEELAARAQTTPTTAREHLYQPSETPLVETTTEGDTTLYCRSSEAAILEQAQDLLERVEPDRLAIRIAEMEDDLQTVREDLGIDSPADVSFEADIDGERLQEWQRIRRNLAIAKVALALSEADATIQETQ